MLFMGNHLPCLLSFYIVVKETRYFCYNRPQARCNRGEEQMFLSGRGIFSHKKSTQCSAIRHAFQVKIAKCD